MKRLYVYADFNWLESPVLIGGLTFDALRGGETYGFSFDKGWLSNFGDIFLSEDLQNFPGMQYTRPGKDIFACFSDALPDRWGRMLMNRREQIAALEEKRSPHRLSSFDFLTGIDDESRMGAFRYADLPGGAFPNCDVDFRVPPVANVRELMHAAHEIEKSEQRNILPAKQWLLQLLQPGSSLGGARPKATVKDEDGSLAVAKFPSRNDDYDVAQWEHFCHVMARKAGVNTAQTRTIETGNYHILLSRRFDRNESGRRIHFASAMSLLGLSDGDSASTGHGYTDIVDFILRYGAEVERDIEELYRRVAFYIIIGNSDDHFRNHGFLLTRKGWRLSPAYDMNPTLSENQSLLINRTTNLSDLNILLNSAEEYMLTNERAMTIVNEVKGAMASWRTEAARLRLPKRDVEMLAPRSHKFCQ